MRAVLTVGLGVGLAASAGCAMEPAALAEATSALTECDVTRCGTNSPSIDGRGFHELNLSGRENAERIRLVRFVKAGQPYQPRVVHGRLLASNGSGTFGGIWLKGAQFIVAEENGHQFAITIENVGTVHYWAALPGTPLATLETYNLDWEPVGLGQRQPLCGNPVGQDRGDLLGMVALTAVMFEGDRIDSVAKTVSSAIDPSWFNIGCAGHAIAKLALTGHTEAARSDGYTTTTQERQAMLKMLVGDYCGRGEPFTGPGERLYWRDDHHWMDYLGPVHPVVDARWTANGAACLGAPRLDVNAPPLMWPPGLAKPVISAILAACPALGPCSDPDPAHQGGFHLVSANPL